MKGAARRKVIVCVPWHVLLPMLLMLHILSMLPMLLRVVVVVMVVMVEVVVVEVVVVEVVVVVVVLVVLLFLWLLSFFCFFFFFLPFSLVSTTVETCRCVHRCTFQLFIRGRLFQCLVAFVTYLSMRYPAYKWRTPNV
mgnify:CR=1 FL=1